MTAQFLLVHENGYVEPFAEPGRIQAGIATLRHVCTSRADALGRSVWNTHEKSLDILGRHFDHVLQDFRSDADGMLRTDDFSAGLGMFNPRDLTHKFRRVLEEKMPPLSSERVFQINTEVPPGALSYEQTRSYTTGEAIVYRGGSGADVRSVGIGQATMKSNVVYYISKTDINWLEQLRINMTGLDTQTRRMRGMRRVMGELTNKWTFFGSEAHSLWGLLNHPYIDTALSTVNYDSGTADDIAEDFGFWANYAENESGSTFQPDTLLIAPKLANALRNRRYGDNADKSLLDWMLSANPHIKNVETVRELNDVGGAGIHVFSFHRRGAGPADASSEIIVPLAPTLLPPDRRALATEIFMVGGHGGLNQREVGDNLNVYVQGVA